MNETKKKNWLVGFLGALGCIIVGDIIALIFQYVESLSRYDKFCGMYVGDFLDTFGKVDSIASVAVIVGFVYFFFWKFWKNGNEIDEGIAGRMRRRSYFVHAIAYGILINLVFTGLVIAITETKMIGNDESLKLEWLSLLLSSPVMVLVIFRYTVRRLHDMGWTCKVAKWQILIAMLTLLGFVFPTLAAIVIIVGYIPNIVLNCIVLFVGGTPGENKYGANPRIK